MNQVIQQIIENRIIHMLVITSLSTSLGYVFIYFLKIYLSKLKSRKEKGNLIQVIPPKYFIDDGNKQGARFALQRFMDNLTASLKNDRISFEIYADSEAIKFLVWTPNKRIRDLVKLNLYSTYGERIKIKDIDKDPIEQFNTNFSIDEYKTAKHDVYMLMDLKDFEAVDPIDGILGAMIGLEDNEKLLLQIVLKPTKLDKISFNKAKENFRLRKQEITWSSIFFNQIESYLIFFIPLLPSLLTKVATLIPKSVNPNEKDTIKLLHDADPRKILVQQDELSDFNKRINEKFKTPFTSYIRVIATGDNPTQRLDYVEQALETMKSETQNKLIRKKSKNFNDLKYRYIYPEDKNFPFYRELFTSQKTLSSREISMLYHLPKEIIDSSIEHFTFPNISAKKKFRNRQSSSDLLLGFNNLREKETKVYLHEEERKKHIVITGQTGTGKSTILKNFLLQDIDNRFLRGTKRGLLLLDPHEDLFLDVLNKLPENRGKNLLIVWDNRNEDHYFGFNPLYAVGLSEREIDLVADSNYKLIEKLINRANVDGGMGVTGKPMLLNAMKTLMIFQLEWLKKNPDKREILERFVPTLTDIRSLFISDEFLSTVLSFIPLEKYEDLRSFWEDILPNYKESKIWSEIRQGFDNKISQLLNGVLYYTFAQSQSSINISECLKESKIVLVNLSPKNIGEEGMSLLGSFLISKFWFEAKRIAQDSRLPFVVYADEFQNFATPDFSHALSEARKFDLELVLAHQFFKQLPQDVFHSVIGNVKTKIFYRAGQEDAEIITKELQGKVLEKEMMEIPEFNAIAKVSEDIFSLYVPKERDNTLTEEKVNNLILSSYFRFGKTRWEIDDEITERRNWFRDGCI